MLSSRGINPNLNLNNKNKPQYSENELIKFLKLNKMVSASAASSASEPQSPTYQQQQQMIPQMSMPMPIQMPMMYPQQQMPMSPMGTVYPHPNIQSELSNAEREDIRRMIYKSNEELEANLKDFIRSNEKKFLEYLKELINYQATVTKAEEIQENEDEKELAESTPASSNQIIDTMKNIPSALSGAFTSMKNTVSQVVNTANNVITGKGSTPAQPTQPPQPTQPTQPTQSTQPTIDEVKENSNTNTNTNTDTNTESQSTKPIVETTSNTDIDEQLKAAPPSQPAQPSQKQIQKPDNIPLVNLNTGTGDGENNYGEEEEAGEEENNEAGEEANKKIQAQNNLIKKQQLEKERMKMANKKANQEIKQLREEVENLGLNKGIKRSQTGGAKKLLKSVKRRQQKQKNEKQKSQLKRKVRKINLL